MERAKRCAINSDPSADQTTAGAADTQERYWFQNEPIGSVSAHQTSMTDTARTTTDEGFRDAGACAGTAGKYWYRMGLLHAAQMAFDQQSDDPQPGTWNDACERIAKLIREGAGT